MTSLENKRKIEEFLQLKMKAPQIAKQLGLSVWTIRKWQQRIKKGDHFTLKWVDLKKVR